MPTKKYIVWNDSGGDGWGWTDFDTLEEVFAFLKNGQGYGRMVITENLDLKLDRV